ncbi:hypothetical protein C0R09_15280 [Brevibacillus laterosporus]|uniref:hypothetical protein n=1 Tax=Brevibacillus laterosporus TaxID=1465 RepID=UPI000C76718E|nr:hypothetical protein [Brevibacillus laterosporus]AUM65764.1 hypothetical protein C0R09_15280 [Brevibacillus laterosporus]
MKQLFTRLIVFFLMVYTLQPQSSQAVALPQQEQTIIYQVSVDGKTSKVIAQLPSMHRGSISPSGRFIYTEKLGYGKNDPTIPYMYDIKTKRLSKLSGYAKWSPKNDMLYIKENNGLVRFDPLTSKKTILVEGTIDYLVEDFYISPDEQYLAFLKIDRKSANPQESAHLYLQDLLSLKMKINDRIAAVSHHSFHSEMMYWLPNSKKLFYQANGSIEELDLPTGLKYTHKQTTFPSFSNDMKYKYEIKEQGEYILDLQTGKKIILQSLPIMERYLNKLHWSPKGHMLAAEEYIRPSNAQDSYSMIRFYKNIPSFTYPFAGTNGSHKLGIYLHYSDNIQIIGWNRDEKSFYVADFSSIHSGDFAPDKQI